MSFRERIKGWWEENRKTALALGAVAVAIWLVTEPERRRCEQLEEIHQRIAHVNARIELFRADGPSEDIEDISEAVAELEGYVANCECDAGGDHAFDPDN